MPDTLRDSLSLLSVVLEQQTELQPTEIMSDTGAYTDTIFGIVHLLGYQFSPRTADIGGTRFWRMDGKADYGLLDDLAAQRINVALIVQHWFSAALPLSCAAERPENTATIPSMACRFHSPTIVWWIPCLAASCAVVSSPRSASSATRALNSAEYRVRLPVIGSVLFAGRTKLSHPSKIPGPAHSDGGPRTKLPGNPFTLP